jgi:hypothetical protein
MRGPSPKENLVSIRLVWPFARLAGAGPRALSLLQSIGIEPADFANPDTRVPHRTVIELLEAGIGNRQDPTIGLQAGSLAEPCDLDVLEYAARSRPTLGEALTCIARYYRLMHGAAEFSLIDQGDRMIYRYRVTDGVYQPPAASDFVLGSASPSSGATAPSAWRPKRYISPTPSPRMPMRTGPTFIAPRISAPARTKLFFDGPRFPLRWRAPTRRFRKPTNSTHGACSSDSPR